VKQVAIAFNSMTKQVQSGQQAMKDFVSNVSHDLKTPLTSIQGFSQALIDGTAHDEQSRRQAATIIHTEAARMRRMVDDLLDLARIDAGQISMQKQNIDLTLLLAVVLDSLVPQLEKKNITLTRQISSLPILLGDGDRLKQVFLNLMDNAIKYTPENGQIMILATHDEVPPNASTLIRQTNTKSEKTKFVKISIIDSGAGIPQEEIDRIFERFYRVDKSRAQENGVGLGLAIAHNIVKAHDGYLEAKSIEGTGSTFTVWLPFTS
jgi:signal transduction histidine kinase